MKMIDKFIFVPFFAALLAFSHYTVASTWDESLRLESLAQYTSALTVMEAIIKEEPNNEYANLRVAWLSYLSGKHSQSIKYYQKALSLNDKSLDAQVGLLLPLLAQSRWVEVETKAKSILSAAPWNYYAHIRLMIAEEALGKWQTLSLHTQEAHHRFPSDVTVLVYQARAHRWLKEVKKAKQAYAKVLRRYPGHIEALQFLAETY